MSSELERLAHFGAQRRLFHLRQETLDNLANARAHLSQCANHAQSPSEGYWELGVSADLKLWDIEHPNVEHPWVTCWCEGNSWGVIIHNGLEAHIERVDLHVSHTEVS